jgi:hypothetical protein
VDEREPTALLLAALAAQFLADFIVSTARIARYNH